MLISRRIIINTSLTDRSPIFGWVQKLKSIFAVFALFVFLFPLVEKGIHNFEHHHYTQCNEHDFVHFHQAEHHCYLCDFTSPASSTPVLYKFALNEQACGKQSFFYTSSSYCLQAKEFQKLRGPPAIA